MRRIVKAFIVLLVIFSGLHISTKAATSNTTELSISGKNDYDKAYEMLAFVNKERRSLGLNELTMDISLLDSAMLRAAEINVDFDHTRPDGSDCFTVNAKASGENIAAGNNTAASTFEQWKNSPGHYANMIRTNFKSMGVGVFTQGGIVFWVQLFSYSDAIQGAKPSNKDVHHKIPTVNEHIELSLNMYNPTFFVGEEIDSELSVRNSNPGWPGTCVELDPTMVTFESTNPSVISINQNGRMKSLSLGTTIIKAKCLGKILELPANTQYDRRYYAFNNESLSLTKGNTRKLKALYTKTQEELNSKLNWESSNTYVAVVDNQGNITAKNEGYTRIRATMKDGVWFADCDVYVKNQPTKITINTTKATLSVGKTFQLKASTNDGTTYAYWSSTPAAASVDQQGNIKALREGMTYITVVSEDGTEAKCLVKVVDLSVKDIKLNTTNATLSIGNGFQAKASVIPSNATNQKITWKPSSPSIATVDQKGNVKAVKAGYTYIVARSNNGIEKKILVKVVEVNPTSVGMNISHATLSIGKSFTAKATVYPTNATNKSVKYSTSNSNIIKVDANGKVTTVGEGTAYVYAKTSNGKTGQIKVTVLPNPTSIAITPKSATVKVGATFKARGIVTPSNATSSVTFKSSSPSIATVDANGNVKAIKEGYTYITVTTVNGKTAKFLMRVVK